MATFTKIPLTGSTDGRGKKIAATSSAGDTIHTGPGAGVQHELWIYAYNAHTAAVVLTIQQGGTTSPDDDIKVSIPNTAGLVLVEPGLIINGNATPLVIKAYAATTNVIIIYGWANVIT